MNVNRPRSPTNTRVTICPCCGFKFSGALSEGCRACGAVPVGEALPRPDHELPYYGRSLILALTGALMVAVFLSQTIIALVKPTPISLGFWAWVSAAETAAWQLKWVAIPVTIVVLWVSRRIYRSMLETPARFCGLGYARGGLTASLMVPIVIAVLIGVTVPERLRRRKEGIQAGILARGYRIDRALRDYEARNGTLPTDPWDLLDKDRLPDPDGSIAEALRGVDLAAYKTSGADLAALPPTETPSLRGAVIRKTATNIPTDDASPERVSFTTYELPLPGVDGITGTEDDLVMRDGLIERASALARKTSAPTASSRSPQP